MPWTAAEAEMHNHRANTRIKRALWATVANEELKKHGDEARAIKEANAAVDRAHGKPK